MHLEIRVSKNRGYYYLSQSVRIGNKVKSFNQYVGVVGIPKKTLDKKIKTAKAILEERIVKYRKEHDLLFNILSAWDIQNLEKIKTEFKSVLKSMPEVAKQRYYDDIGVRFTFNTNAIEGSTLTLVDTHLILHDKVAPKGKTLIEIREAENHKKAYDFMRRYKGKVNKKFILRLHEIIASDILIGWAGRFRQWQVTIGASDIKTTEPEDIDREINKLMRWYGKVRKESHPVIIAAVFHARFEVIHPFLDYNGRVGRLILNYMLEDGGYPFVVIRAKKKQEYYKTLNSAQKGDPRPFVRFLIKYLSLSSKS